MSSPQEIYKNRLRILYENVLLVAECAEIPNIAVVCFATEKQREQVINEMARVHDLYPPSSALQPVGPYFGLLLPKYKTQFDEERGVYVTSGLREWAFLQSKIDQAQVISITTKTLDELETKLSSAAEELETRNTNRLYGRGAN